MQLTFIDLNSWIFRIGDRTLLVDPWLVDPMVFYGIPFLFTAYHRQAPAFTPQTLPPIDAILLSQGLDDHCHIPTLERLDRSIPVLASPSAAKVARKLGYQQVQALSPWESHSLGDVSVLAVPGASIQGQLENGYVLEDTRQRTRLYYEPHQFRPETGIAEKVGRVDVAIAPVIGQIFPLLGEVIMGPQQALALAQALRPQVYVPTTHGEINASGLLPKVIRSVGSLAEFEALLAQHCASTRVQTPAPGETLDLSALVKAA